MVEGKQLCVVCQQPEDIVKKAEVVMGYINMLDKKYGYEAHGTPAPLAVKCGRKHEYLGMLLDFTN